MTTSKNYDMRRAVFYNKDQYDGEQLSMEQITELVYFWQVEHDLVADAKAGPATLGSISKAYLGVELSSPSALGLEMLDVAIEELGKGEVGSNNVGPHVAKYKQVIGIHNPEDAGAWCAALMSYCLVTASDRMQYTPKTAVSGGAKALYNNACQAGLRLDYPIPGALVCWDRGTPGSWQGHIGIVEKYEGGILHTIEGNKGAVPAKVRRCTYDLSTEGRLMGFARVV